MRRRYARLLAVALLGSADCGGDEPQSASTTGGHVSGATTSGGNASGDASTTAAGGLGGAGSGGQAGGNAHTGGVGGATGPFPGNYDCAPAAGQPPPLELTTIGTFVDPMLVRSAPGDGRLYVVEQGGRIRIVEGETTLAAPFLDVSSLVKVGGSEGLLALAFHPSYSENGRFFLHYSAAGSGNSIVAEFARSPDANVANPNAVAKLLDEPQVGDQHNGGSIEFGSDGMLYVAFGDGAGTPALTSQAQDSRLGKILRIDVSTTPYSIPAGNMPGGLPEIWDMGLRNPHRVSFDPCTGDLYISDVGDLDVEEINVEAAGVGHYNYGWNTMEGSGCHAGLRCDVAGLALPTVEYGHAEGCAVIGGYVHRGAAIPALRGAYFYGDHCSGQIWSFVWLQGQVTAQTAWSPGLFAGDPIRSFGQDDAGNVYVVSGNNVYRIDAR